MTDIIALLLKALGQTWLTLQHNWPFLLVSILVATAMKLYMDTNAVAAFLRRHQRSGVAAATAAAVATPLCSCGTTAIVLGMMAGSMPWAPIVAFMVASPLTSPEELIYSAGLFGWPFALAFFGASIILGLMGGAVAHALDARGWLKNQARFAADQEPAVPEPSQALSEVSLATEAPSWELASRALQSNGTVALANGSRMAAASGECGCDTVAPAMPIFLVAPEPCGCAGDTAGSIQLPTAGTCGCSGPVIEPIAVAPRSKCGCADATTNLFPPTTPSTCGCGAPAGGERDAQPRRRPDLKAFGREVFVTGRRLLLLFAGFAFVGYLINDLIPAAWITALFGAGHSYSVPLAATLGLPFYINSEASLPLVRAMLNSGMSSGAALAFLITGAGTSIGAIAGAMTIARWRVIGLVVGTLWVGAVLCGLGYDTLVRMALL